MPFFDFSLTELQAYKPPRGEPADFDAFWAATLEEVRQHPSTRASSRWTPACTRWRYSTSPSAGYGDQPIKGWLLLPRQRSGPLPCVVEYIGYGGGRGFPFDWLLWSAAGYAHLVMDTRGQGSSLAPGRHPRPRAGRLQPAHPGLHDPRHRSTPTTTTTGG